MGNSALLLGVHDATAVTSLVDPSENSAIAAYSAVLPGATDVGPVIRTRMSRASDADVGEGDVGVEGPSPPQADVNNISNKQGHVVPCIENPGATEPDLLRAT